MQTFKLAMRMLLAACVGLPVSGCWDNKDINHRALPVVMGISKADETFKVTLQIPEPAGTTTQTKIVTDTGSTITQAVDKISMNLESNVDLLHLKVVLFEKPYAQQGLNESISGFMRSRDISPKALVVICDEDLDTFFARVTRTKQPSGTPLYDFFEKNAGWSPQIALTRIWQVYRSIHSFTRDVAIPIIRSGKSTQVEHIGTAVIKNGKMVERISPDDTLLFNAFQGQSTQGKIEVMDHASVLVVSNTIRHKSGLANGRPHVESVINLKVSVLETRETPSTASIQKDLETLLTGRFNRMFAKIQAAGADILGIGQLFRAELNREQLKRWRTDYYPDVNLDFRVQAVIQNQGHLKAPAD
ncbi:Ger(x)C family spore germination protein [Paenibacillus sp. GYB003]|uniref:Ger(x)C family spore germination protein n=1 Tax=Paenibacillus sp. GYB003 TaxID=2994392 RepID=UPI002F96284C